MLQVNFSPFPQLTTERLILRRVTKADVQEVFFLRSDKRVMKYIDKPLAQSLVDAYAFIERVDHLLENNEGINWGISIKDNSKLIGNIGFWRMEKEHFRCEVGYVLHPDFHRKGIMQEAMAAALKYCFEVMHFHSVEANVNPLNEASIKLLENNNFVREAYFKENYYFNGRFLDSAIYSLISPVTHDSK